MPIPRHGRQTTWMIYGRLMEHIIPPDKEQIAIYGPILCLEVGTVTTSPIAQSQIG